VHLAAVAQLLQARRQRQVAVRQLTQLLLVHRTVQGLDGGLEGTG
jgi:hypothetical protein